MAKLNGEDSDDKRTQEDPTNVYRALDFRQSGCMADSYGSNKINGIKNGL